MSSAPMIFAAILWIAAMVDFISAAWKAGDRSRLVTGALFALFGTVAARALLPADPLASWAWVAGVTAYAAVMGRAVLRGRGLPWVHPGATRKNILGAVLWGTTVVALTAGVLWSFV